MDPTRTIDAGGPVGPAPPMALKVVVVPGPDDGKEAPLISTVEGGADPACQLSLQDPAASRKHVSVSLAGGSIVVRDLGSRNGTFLGGTRLKEAEVSVGAVLTVGKSSIVIQPRWHVREVAPSAKREFGELSGES